MQNTSEFRLSFSYLLTKLVQWMRDGTPTCFPLRSTTNARYAYLGIKGRGGQWRAVEVEGLRDLQIKKYYLAL